MNEPDFFAHFQPIDRDIRDQLSRQAKDDARKAAKHHLHPLYSYHWIIGLSSVSVQ